MKLKKVLAMVVLSAMVALIGAPVAVQAEEGVAGAPRTYTTVRGDCLSTIAKKVYGTQKAWTVIYEANKDAIGKNYLIYANQTFVIPDLPAEFQPAPAETPAAPVVTPAPVETPAPVVTPAPAVTGASKTYTTVRGDYLRLIAQKMYGTQDAWTVIYEANKDAIGKNYLIYANQTFVIPDLPAVN